MKINFSCSVFIAFQAVAQEGIRFRHCSWEEAKAMAKKKKTDFYRFLYPMVRPLPEYG